MSIYRVVYVTCPAVDVARKIAEKAVQERLAACVNIIPGLVSIYRWEGQIEEGSECLMVIKTSQAQLQALETMVIEAHPFDVPEFVVLSIESGSEKYLQWLADSVG